MKCDRCIHKPVCKFRLEGKIDELERLTVCCCYVEVDNPDDFLIKGDLDYIEQKPIKRVAEVRHGEWIAYGLINPQCSLCKKYHISKDNYCPNCGAKMDGKEVANSG